MPSTSLYKMSFKLGDGLDQTALPFSQSMVEHGKRVRAIARGKHFLTTLNIEKNESGETFISAYTDIFSPTKQMIFERTLARRTRLPIERVVDQMFTQLTDEVCADLPGFLNRPIRPVTGLKSLLFPPGAGGMLIHEVVGHMLEKRAHSLFADMVGEKVGPKFLTVVDDPTIAQGFGSFTQDEEGAASEKKYLIREGRIETMLGMTPGNLRRQTENHIGLPRMSNTYMAEVDIGCTPSSLADEAEVRVRRFGPGRVGHRTGRFELVVREAIMRDESGNEVSTEPFFIKGDVMNVFKNMRAAAGPTEMYSSYCAGLSGVVPVSYGQPFVFVENQQCLPFKNIQPWRVEG